MKYLNWWEAGIHRGHEAVYTKQPTEHHAKHMADELTEALFHQTLFSYGEKSSYTRHDAGFFIFIFPMYLLRPVKCRYRHVYCMPACIH